MPLANSLSNLRIAFLATGDGTQQGRSGYTVLADYFPNKHLFSNTTTKTPHYIGKFANRVLRLGSASNWYSHQSFGLEFKAWSQNVQFDVIHLLWGERDWGYLDRILRRSRTKLVGTFHACPDDFHRIIRHRERLKAFSAVILMSECQREVLVDAGVSPERIFVIQHGIDTKHFYPSKHSRSPDGFFNLLHVGSYRRNFELLEQLAVAIANHKDIRLTLVTNQSIGQRFQSFSNVVVRSNVSDDELRSLYQASDCLVATAKAATANNAILEALASGLPIIGEEVGGIPEYLRNDCSITIAPDSLDSLLRAVELLRSRSELRAEMAIAARKRALELDWERVAMQTLAVYKSITSQ